MKAKLLFLGQCDIHQRAFLPFLSQNHYDVTVVDTSPWFSDSWDKIPGTGIPLYGLYANSKLRFLFRDRFEFFTKVALYSLADKTKLTFGLVKEILEEQDINIIYGSWGSLFLPEMDLVRKFRIPLVYEFLTYPNTIFNPTVKAENIFNKSVIESLDGRILSCHTMLNYMQKMFNLSNGKNVVSAECYPEKFFFQKRLPLLSEKDGQSHLVFIGLDLNDVFYQIKELTRRKIHVHVYDSTGMTVQQTWKSSEFLHTYSKFRWADLCSGKFATFLTQFDACLVTYNFRRASNMDRYHNSLPNRFSLAITAGLPLVLPRGFLLGCEEMVNQHQIGFSYASYDDLKNKVHDDRLMDKLRRNAVEKSRGFCLENNFAPIDAFLRHVTRPT